MPDKQILLTPGPVAVPPQVLEEMAKPIIHHRTKAFKAIYTELCDQLKQVFRTEHPVMPITGSGTTAYEAAQLSLAKPGSKVLTLAAGKFGERWQDVYQAYAPFLDLTQIQINHNWGTGAPLDRVEQALKDNPDVSVVTVVHSETSTATRSDVQAIARLTRGTDAVLIVDGITSVGAFECEMDDWGIDCLVTGSQKAMMLPPGLGYVGLGPMAQQRLEAIRHDLPAYNLDLRKWLASYHKQDVPFTPPVSLIRGQKVACDLILGEGLDQKIERTKDLAARSRAAFEAMGLKLISSSPSESVTGAFYPEGVDDAAFRGALRDDHGIHIAGGQDGRGAKWKGKIFRISHMGHLDESDTRTGLEAIETELNNAGGRIEKGVAAKAFDGVAV